jgi:hypothetical protein
MTGKRWAVLASALALAFANGTQAIAAEETSRNDAAGASAAARTSCGDPCQACMKSIQTGATDESCPNACASCDEQRRARAEAQPGRSAGEPSSGSDVRTSLDQVGSNVSKAVSNAASDVGRNIDQARQSGMSARRFGESGYHQTLITDIVGTFAGQGLNVEYQRPLSERISGVVGANYSRSTSTTGSLTNFGGEVGLDYFPFSEVAGAGFRVGPRAALQMGQQSMDKSRFFTDFGLGGELGYNWVGSSGLSLQVAGGLGGKVGGALTSGLDTRLGGDFGPYGKVNVGWSW